MLMDWSYTLRVVVDMCPLLVMQLYTITHTCTHRQTGGSRLHPCPNPGYAALYSSTGSEHWGNWVKDTWVLCAIFYNLVLLYNYLKNSN